MAVCRNVLTKHCLGCGKEFAKKPSHSMKAWLERVKYCSKECMYPPRTAKVCHNCGSEFDVPAWRESANFCSKLCAYTDPDRRGKTSERIKAHPIPGSEAFLFAPGHEVTESTKAAVRGAIARRTKKSPVMRPCEQCGLSFVVRSPGATRYQKFCSKPCADKAKDHGLTSEQKRIRESRDYDIWRKAVFERDDYTCVLCGAHGVVLNADHIKRFAEYPELRFDVGNGRTLCVPCHKDTPTYGNKRQVEVRRVSVMGAA